MASWLPASRFGLALVALLTMGTEGRAQTSSVPSGGGSPSSASPSGGLQNGTGRPATAQESAEAQRHFKAAQDYYQQGAYNEAMTELRRAVTLDPGAKELYYNLGVVHEKLDDIDTALEYFRKYESFELDAQEKARVEKVIRRLEGAKAQRPGKAPPVAVPPVSQPAGEVVPPAPPPVTDTGTPRGRVDGWTLGAAGLTAASLGVGIGFGIWALSSRPKEGYTTGVDGSYADLENALGGARDKAVVADVSFVVAGLSAVATAALYFTRPRDASPSATATAASRAGVSSSSMSSTSASRASASRVTVSRVTVSRVGVAPAPGGGALWLGGQF